MSFIKKIFNKDFFKKDIAVAAVCALVFSALLSLTGFDTKCQELRDKVLRLHILANSDSAEDQAIKLKVRDKLLELSGELYEQAKSKEDAIKLTETNATLFKSAAEQTIKECGKDQKVSISIGKAYFNTREYENFTLPAGEYDAVRVLIGNAEGKNWWCVMFPSMCIPAAAEDHSLTEAVDEDVAEIAENAPHYEVRFKVVEWYEELKNFLKGNN